jgi:RNA polymerase sigma-70 factor (ECF subfamily)
MLGDPAEAEDVAQETFIRVWKAAGRFESGRAQVTTWISRIAINLCYDRLRKRREVLMDEMPERADETPDQEARLTRRESGNRVVDAVNQLPERQRMAMELVHFQEMSNIAAAEIMSVSVEALESLLARGRRKLKALLMDQAGDLISSYHSVAVAQEGVER